MTGRNAVKNGHHDIKQHKVVFAATVHLVDSLEAIELQSQFSADGQARFAKKTGAEGDAQQYLWRI
jgi:hypothetical protein